MKTLRFMIFIYRQNDFFMILIKIGDKWVNGNSTSLVGDTPKIPASDHFDSTWRWGKVWGMSIYRKCETARSCKFVLIADQLNQYLDLVNWCGLAIVSKSICHSITMYWEIIKMQAGIFHRWLGNERVWKWTFIVGLVQYDRYVWLIYFDYYIDRKYGL